MREIQHTVAGFENGRGPLPRNVCGPLLLRVVEAEGHQEMVAPVLQPQETKFSQQP